jgi:3-deoxy-D-manno-octulosonic-acid transferase
MGEMPAYFAMADVALIGGSLLPLGGQNLIEACACGCPVVVGPYMFNFAQATSDALAAGAARSVADADGAIDALSALDANVRSKMSQAALKFAAAHAGATARTRVLLEELV